jgi:uncharacterized protein YbjT (DUF2867 family)
MNKREALIFGSTGLIGNLLLEELIHSDSYSGIKIFVRHSTGITDPKVEEIITDFSNPSLYSNKITGDDLFICLGTTIKKAGSIANMGKIDRDIPLQIASIASDNGVKRVAVVSSLGASPQSSNYYLRIKGEMENGILGLRFENIVIVRPSILLGKRKERRSGESFGKVIIKIIEPFFIGRMKKYRGIHGRKVARAMIRIINSKIEKQIYESDELSLLSN